MPDERNCGCGCNNNGFFDNGAGLFNGFGGDNAIFFFIIIIFLICCCGCGR